MALPRFYNTLTRRTEELVLREPGHARVYCCGPTVYDVPHVGHGRAALVSRHSGAPAARQGPRSHLRAQHHRHRRQDPRTREEERRNAARALAADGRGLPGADAGDRLPRSRARAPSQRSSAADPSADRKDPGARKRVRRWSCRAANATSISPSAVLPATASFRGERSTTCWSERASKPTRASAIRSISRCGRAWGKANGVGTARGAAAGPAGTSNAPR